VAVKAAEAEVAKVVAANVIASHKKKVWLKA
jgi:hypothetical protein